VGDGYDAWAQQQFEQQQNTGQAAQRQQIGPKPQVSTDGDPDAPVPVFPDHPWAPVSNLPKIEHIDGLAKLERLFQACGGPSAHPSFPVMDGKIMVNFTKKA